MVSVLICAFVYELTPLWSWVFYSCHDDKQMPGDSVENETKLAMSNLISRLEKLHTVQQKINSDY